MPRSKEFKRQIEIGHSIGLRLPQVMSQGEVAKKLGISRQMVGRIEAQALYKVQQRLKQLLAEAL